MSGLDCTIYSKWMPTRRARSKFGGRLDPCLVALPTVATFVRESSWFHDLVLCNSVRINKVSLALLHHFSHVEIMDKGSIVAIQQLTLQKK